MNFDKNTSLCFVVFSFAIQLIGCMLKYDVDFPLLLQESLFLCSILWRVHGKL